ncbi:MAG: tyrosine-type recombinase/integrase [Verrucomicrobiota bacterium]
MKLSPATLRGKLGWIVDCRVNGKGSRQFFEKHGEALKAFEDAKKQRAAIGRAYDVLPARKKSRIAAILDEIQKSGHSLEDVWMAVKTGNGQKAVPVTIWTLETAVKETVKAKRAAARREDYIKGLELYLKQFIKGRESMAINQGSDRWVKDIEKWFADRNELPDTRNSNIGRLSAMFGTAWRRGIISENPCARVERASVDSKPPATLTHRQYTRALLWSLKECPGFLAWLTLALFVGLRPEAEADELNWNDIDLKRRRIVITKTKVRNHRIIDLKFCRPAIAWLTLAKLLGSPLDISLSTRRRYLRKLRAHLGFKRWPQDVLRHTAASNLLAFHQDAGKVAAFLGNSVSVLLRRYKALIFREDAERFMKCRPKKRHFRKPV